MPRKGPVSRREIPPDPLYHSVIVHRLVNTVMMRGKKSLAERIVYSALDQVRERSGQDSVKVLDKALHNVMPLLEVRPRRVGGATYQVPIEVRPERRLSLGLRWLVDYARQRKDKRTMTERLVAEILDASNGQGGAVKKREDTHRMAEANKAFAHYRW
ncbi:MAG: 30S ribosomal protein S7 [Armatimonadota bacterium]|nr:30S ribosomal protein S7 [Armatimonadota bacterium]MDR7468192.1 30S ribosomal protein S7 [Armatimonadota bacterium]MDR7495052.1 30S ribosomal protein S7 [Armatimonadota bacterium]MDR7500128.1 30S ribosomal protein S7 [Armatimonadota bacterium]MDR7505692.1 30S ribosomal protein S7 [Armatimonadota bacterium]